MADSLINVETRVSWTVGPVVGAVGDATLRGLVLWGDVALAESNSKAPHDAGDLERSGSVISDRGAMAAHVSYDTPYAVRQHEELDYRHEPGRTAKYLENAVNKTRDDGMKILAREIGGALA